MRIVVMSSFDLFDNYFVDHESMSRRYRRNILFIPGAYFLASTHPIEFFNTVLLLLYGNIWIVRFGRTFFHTISHRVANRAISHFIGIQPREKWLPTLQGGASFHYMHVNLYLTLSMRTYARSEVI